MQGFTISHQQCLFYTATVYEGEKSIVGNDAFSSHRTHRNTKNKKNQTGSFGIQHKMKTDVIMASSLTILPISKRANSSEARNAIQASLVAKILVMEKLFIKRNLHRSQLSASFHPRPKTASGL